MDERVVTALKSILIINDDPSLSDSLVHDLQSKGFRVGLAGDGHAAFQQMKEGQYDCILIDVMMPGMNGMETLRQIKAVRPGVITMIMTGRSQIEGFVSEALWTGVDGVLYKPFEADNVIEMIERRSREQDGMVSIDLTTYPIPPKVLDLVPEEMARKYTLLPLKIEGEHLLVAMADPNNLYAIEDLRVRTALRIKPLRVSRSDIESAFAAHYQESGEIEREVQRISSSSNDTEVSAAQRLSAELVAQTPVVRAVELMLRQAVRDQASDIHLEPHEDYLKVRYRIDGVLHDAMRLPARVHAPIMSRIKVMSNLNIAERRRPQDGQFGIVVEGKPIDFRVATISTVHGEMAVLRVLDKSVSVRGLDEIGFLPQMQTAWENLIHSPWGIILIAGPTGSGKTSTLYASMNQLDHDENKIITIEDPVEYRVSGISQVQVNRQAGITFASGLRSAMRLDPDVILVGEIRDQETASTAVQASLTGHLVFSSIHANDTIGAVYRLIDLGVEPFLVTSSLLGVISQRLVRRTCTECGTLQEASPTEIVAYEKHTGEARSQFYSGTGCAHCAETGYRGRIAVFELLQMNDTLRRMILQDTDSDSLREAAIESGMKPMMHDGMLKARRNITTPREILKEIFSL